MIKTLYVRVVLTFLGAFILGQIGSFFLTLGVMALFTDQYIASNHRSSEAFGAKLIQLYGQYGVDGAEPYFQTMDSRLNYDFKLADAGGTLRSYPAAGEVSIVVSDSVISSVLAGETYRSRRNEGTSIITGVPFNIDSHRYALLIKPSVRVEGRLVMWIVLLSLVIALILGSLFTLIAARYIVKPLRVMKDATRRIAKGDFDIDFGWHKRRDEIGELAQSFSDMTRDIKQLEQMRSDFVSNVSHEIQTPLTSISGFSKALRHKALKEEDRSRYLDIIQAESERLSRMSENLLKLASLESDRHPFEPRTYDLDEQIRRAVVACEPQWSGKSIELELDLPQIKICADEDQMSQVWINLIGNSIKFTPEGGRIAVSIRQTTDRIEVAVADTGIGISAADRGNVFDRFFKADRSHTNRQQGSGLGLAIVKRIVTLHSGIVKLESEPGKGTTVKVNLPSFSTARRKREIPPGGSAGS
ncbi:HAMP domain-containing sensor histidine kinase [Paenibacillus hodogayensis]|uniref:Heme sensor protein HssS n=1 Tax=Paenibacillus hodogayensis TaxID=279208 RepID=A0ABV5VU26_9BACL